MGANQQRRADDSRAVNRNRCDRYFSLDGQWFFTTREGLIMGPYDSQEEAQSQTRLYIRFVNTAPRPVVSILKRRSATS